MPREEQLPCQGLISAVFLFIPSSKLTDPHGAVLAKVTSTGTGAAEFTEFNTDFSHSARRAVAEAVKRLVQEVRKNETLR